MLRESSESFGYEVELRAVTDRSFDSGIPGGEVLLDFADATLTGVESLPAARRAVVDELGAESMVEAAGVIGNFAMMNRIADAVGMPMSTRTLEATTDLRAALNLDRLRHH